jgi:U3 small nucleolar RNA-associated protein 14
MDPSSKESRDNDEEEQEETGDGDEFIDLVDALDGKGDTDAEVDDTKKDPTGDTGLHSEDDEMSSEGEFENTEDAGDDGTAFAPSDDEEGPEAFAQLHNFVSNLELTVKKRKIVDEGDTQDTNDRTRKRRLLQETTEAGDENEFRVQSIGTLPLSILLLILTYFEVQNSTLMTFLRHFLDIPRLFSHCENPQKS